MCGRCAEVDGVVWIFFSGDGSDIWSDTLADIDGFGSCWWSVGGKIDSEVGSWVVSSKDSNELWPLQREW